MSPKASAVTYEGYMHECHGCTMMPAPIILLHTMMHRLAQYDTSIYECARYQPQQPLPNQLSHRCSLAYCDGSCNIAALPCHATTWPDPGCAASDLCLPWVNKQTCTAASRACLAARDPNVQCAVLTDQGLKAGLRQAAVVTPLATAGNH